MESWQIPLVVVEATMLTFLLAGVSFLVYTVTYNTLFHPLAKCPGPFIARFTNLYAAWHAWKGDMYLDMWRCHLKYGDRIRYGPNRILINTAEAVHDIYGRLAPVKKFEGYRVLASKAPNMLTMSDKTQHARRRRVISQAFSEGSMRKFEPILVAKLDRFCQLLRACQEDSDQWTSPLNMASRFNYLVFDILTTVAFGADYNTMEQSRFRHVLDAISETNIRLSVVMQASKLTLWHLDRKVFTQSAKAGYKFVKFLRKLLKDRLANDAAPNDIFSFLQQCKDPETGKGLSDVELSTETATFLVAGSDTTSTTLSALSYYLSSSPRCYRRVAEEVRRTFKSSDEIRLGPKLNSCVFLRACVDETLRLSPPGGATFWREVEAGGASFGGDFVPGGCEVGVAVCTMHHHPGYWVDPFAYKPERWLNDRGKAKDQVDLRLPYFPFSIGSRSCVGKPLAISQIMLTYARLFWEFDFRKAETSPHAWEMRGNGEDNDAEFPDYTLKEHVAGRGEGPSLCFKARF
ncbi:cytochrome P450 [Hypoxylon argillaceum]|nr:cytochrome P450 [Hypoxylon argillaceum]